MKTLIAGSVLFPSAAFAHSGNLGLVLPFHLATEPDHLAMIGLGLAVAIAVTIRLWFRT